MRGYAQKLIHELDPGVNAVGVEAHMRLQYGTLDHLSREAFAEECRIARACEASNPGYLEACAGGPDWIDPDYEKEERRLRNMDDFGSPAYCSPNAGAVEPDAEVPEEAGLRMYVCDSSGRVWPVIDCDGTWHGVVVAIDSDWHIELRKHADRFYTATVFNSNTGEKDVRYGSASPLESHALACAADRVMEAQA